MIMNIKENKQYLKEYITLCYEEWSDKKKKLDVDNKIKKIDKEVISVLALIIDNQMVGFISLFYSDGDYKKELSPWYATMYVKKEFRDRGFSKVLNDAILKEASSLGYKRVYLKSFLTNYYEKFGAEYIETLENGEKLYYIDC